ncbi:MAG: site-specific integrase [Planctomycetes bacterium]|nr:site-specific integrase [Planctomycetota bacterium]
MIDDTKVWIRSRKLNKTIRRKRGDDTYADVPVKTYDLRWVDPVAGKWRSRSVGTDRKRANGERVILEKALADGTHQSIRRTTWADFVAEHVASLPGKANAAEARHALDEFGETCGAAPRAVTFGMIETYVDRLRTKGNATATINKKLRYLRGALRKGVRRGYLAKSPMEGWQWAREDDKAIRIVLADEETALLDAAETLYGARWRAFVYVALNTGGRRGELLGLTWGRVDLDEARVHFAKTKGKKDRFVPIAPEVVVVLRRLQAQTLQAGGPFVGMGNNINRAWSRIRKTAGVSDVTIHDLRRTYVTRLVRAGVPLPTVQKLAGHANMATTMRYYTQVDDADLRAGVEKLRTVAAG